jgi:DNA-binding transcriptional regulator YiaG
MLELYGTYGNATGSHGKEGQSKSMKNLAQVVPAVELAPVLTGSQIRAARALLKWTGHVLAKKSGVSYAALQRAERTDEMPNMQVRNLAAIKAALENGGVLFLDNYYSGDGGPGVRLR